MICVEESSELWLRRFLPAPGARARVVCFPHAGGSATYYLPMARALAPDVEVVAVQYPGRQDRRHEPCLDSVAELADAAVEALASELDRPVALFGHSMGASVAFEVAARLRRRGLEPAALFVSGRRAPTHQRDECVHLGDDTVLLDEVRRLGGTAESLLASEELRRMVLPVLRADYRAAETYRWPGGDPLTIPLHVHVGDRDPKVGLDEARAWRDLTTGRFTMTTYTGGHFYLGDHAGALTAAIAAELPRAA